jgi:hypothetical protein
MNQADILKLAEDCMIAQSYNAMMNTYFASPKQLIRFAELVAQHERDACLKLAQDLADMYAEREYYKPQELRTDAETGLRELEEAIRARGVK